MTSTSLPATVGGGDAEPPPPSSRSSVNTGGGRSPWRRTGRLAALLFVPVVVVVFGLVAYPIVRTVWLSVHRVLSPMPAAPTTFVGFDNFISALTDRELLSATGHTIYFTLVSTAVELVLGVLLGHLMAQRLRFRWLLRAAILLPWALPTVVSASMWRYVFNANYGPLNALLAQTGIIHHYQSWLGSPFLALNMIVVADVWKNTSIAAFFVLAGLAVIPGEVKEAASVDGAGSVRRFFSVTLPLLKPVIMVVLVLRTIEAFKVFDIIYVMTRGGPGNGTQTVAVYAYFMAFSNQNFGYGSAIAMLIVIVILLLAVAYIRMLSIGATAEDSR